MLRCPINNLLVKIDKEYSDELVFKSGVKLHIDPSWNPNFHATSIGTVVSTPVVIKGGRPTSVKVGDKVLFSYKVVGDTTFENDPKAFRKITEGYISQWQNADKEGLQMQLVAPLKKLWAAVYTDKWGEPVDGKSGTKGEVERWCSQFKFTSAQGFSYDHKIEYEGEEYWKVDLDFVFAVKKKGWKMLGEYVMIEPLVEKKPELMISGLVRTETQQVQVREDKGWVRSIPKKHGGLFPGEVALFDGGMKENYNINGAPHYIVRQRYILGKE